MGTAAFERDAVIEIDGQKYRMLRKVSNTCWQLEHSRTARISELEQEQLLRMYADRKLKFATAVGGPGCGTVHIQVSETARLRRLYVLAALKTDTLWPEAIRRDLVSGLRVVSGSGESPCAGIAQSLLRSRVAGRAR